MRPKRKPRIEVRKDEDGSNDELVIRKPALVHFERMSDSSICCVIDVGRKRLHVNIGAMNQKSSVYFRIEDWGEEV